MSIQYLKYVKKSDNLKQIFFFGPDSSHFHTIGSIFRDPKLIGPPENSIYKTNNSLSFVFCESFRKIISTTNYN
jgi:hypothetical protein